MAQMWTEKRVVISPDAPTLASDVAERLLVRVIPPARRRTSLSPAADRHCRAARRRRALGAPTSTGRSCTSGGATRCSPADDPERNDARRAPRSWTASTSPARTSTRSAASDDAPDGCRGGRVRRRARAFRHAEQAWPEFYVCFLGVGPDGHIASLFPDRARSSSRIARSSPVRDAPKPPAVRHLTRPVINSARCVWLVVSGTDKAAALGLALAGASYETVPAAGAKGASDHVLRRRGRRGERPAELIDQDF
jgi:6-phosphogluconolactonase